MRDLPLSSSAISGQRISQDPNKTIFFRVYPFTLRSSFPESEMYSRREVAPPPAEEEQQIDRERCFDREKQLKKGITRYVRRNSADRRRLTFGFSGGQSPDAVHAQLTREMPVRGLQEPGLTLRYLAPGLKWPRTSLKNRIWSALRVPSRRRE